MEFLCVYMVAVDGKEVSRLNMTGGPLETLALDGRRELGTLVHFSAPPPPTVLPHRCRRSLRLERFLNWCRWLHYKWDGPALLQPPTTSLLTSSPHSSLTFIHNIVRLALILVFLIPQAIYQVFKRTNHAAQDSRRWPHGRLCCYGQRRG